MSLVKVERALVSVSDKAGVAEFARALAKYGVEIVSTGGTAKALEEAGVPVTSVDEITGFPEMMEGRVKTLHPKVHGALLADRSKPEHLAQAEEHGIGLIDMVVVNLYPFEATVAREGVTFEEAIENIDIGGPSMLRSAAKNHAAVTVVTEPGDYSPVLKEMDANGGATTLETRRELALKVFRKTAGYDAAISSYLEPEGFPERLMVGFEKVQDLRYGENPHQEAAFYRDLDAQPHTLARALQIHGKELSYNNILDADAALRTVTEFIDPACIIIKHNNPCGSAIAGDVVEAYAKALDCDPVSAFGSVIAVNRQVTLELAQTMKELFVEVLLAPAFDADALKLLGEKQNIRLMTVGEGRHPSVRGLDLRKVDGGLLVQNGDVITEDRASMTVATERQPTHEEWEQLLFAWRVAMHTKSNCILLAKDYAGVGVGAGQMSRVDSAMIAVRKAGPEKVTGSICASDAFMPFPDALEVVGDAGCTAVIQPGGSKGDEAVIEAANARDMTMVFTGHRHFRH